MPLYKSMFLPYLECYIQFWFPSSKNDAAELEKVQGKARKMMKLPYEKKKKWARTAKPKEDTKQGGSNIKQKSKVT